MRQRSCLALALLLFVLTTLQAQQKKTLTPDDYAKWQLLQPLDLSATGEWIAYMMTRQEDNDTLFVVNRLTSQVYKLEFAGIPQFSRDNQWLACQVGVAFKEAEKIRDRKETIRYKVLLLNLRTGKKEFIQDAGTFRFSRNSKFFTVSLNPPAGNKDRGSVLLLRNLADSTTRTIGNVVNSAFNKKSDYLAYIVQSANNAGNSVELFNLNTYTLRVIASDTANFGRLAWQKEGDAFVFTKTLKDEAYEEESSILYAYTQLYQKPVLKIFNPSKEAGFPKGLRIDAGNIGITDDQQTVTLALSDWTVKPKKDEKKPGADSSKTKADSSKIRTDSTKIKTDSTKVKTDSTKNITAKPPAKDDKPAGVDIWHWKDGEIQPRQKMTYARDKDINYPALWHLGNNKLVRLSKDSLPRITTSVNKKYAITYTSERYKPAFKEDFADYYIVNGATGEEKLLLEKMLADYYGAPMLSPDGKFAVYFKDKHWWSYNTATGQTVNLTASIPYPFWNTRDDHPAIKPPFGIGGFTKGDAAVFLYDEYDVWLVKSDGKVAKNLTNSKKEEIVCRVLRTDDEEPSIDDTKPVLFSAYGDKSKKYGFAKLEKGKFQFLNFEDKLVNRLIKAKEADVYTYLKQDYDVSPELYVTEQFNGEKKISGSNLQQQDYFWGKSQLVNFTSRKGKKMQGALFYPANYEPGKQYPMVVYIYETLSNTVHTYISPSIRSPYNTTNFTTNGYFIFRPDIVYETNDPGMSAVDCVVPAVEEVLKTGMIDKNKVGLMGHSWGAYQTSFIITQTDLFKAAIAGAPLTDLISMSLSIYWNSGTPDQKIFETSQGRFDGPWYDKMEAHMRNSPMFQADKIKTPLLVAFGDKDGAVDWHQGIQMYGTMRRMQKEHVMLVYADENHGLAKKENQIDYTRRQWEWFDHYLLGKPATKWITEGVSYLDKMKEQEKANKPQQ